MSLYNFWLDNEFKSRTSNQFTPLVALFPALYRYADRLEYINKILSFTWFAKQRASSLITKYSGDNLLSNNNVMKSRLNINGDKLWQGWANVPTHSIRWMQSKE